MTIIIENESEHEISSEQEKLIESIIKKSIETEKYNNMAEVGVTVVTNKRIKELNKEFRNKDCVTDVLSFPLIDFELGELPPKSGKYLLGDIAFSFDKAVEQAKEYGHSIDREIGFFIAHSMLHLMGYDHQDESSERVMFKKQEQILDAVGLTR